MISLGAVRVTALVVCAAGIVGMIATSILDHNGAAVTLGLITAVAVLCSMVAKAVAADAERRLGAGAMVEPPKLPDTDVLAEIVEGQVHDVVGAGANEDAVRRLVGEAVRLGRALAAASAAKSGSH